MKPILEINKNFLYTYWEIATYFGRSLNREYLKRLKKKWVPFINYPGIKSQWWRENKYLYSYLITWKQLIEYLWKRDPTVLLTINIIETDATDPRNLQQALSFIRELERRNINNNNNNNWLRSNDVNTKSNDKPVTWDEQQTEINEEGLE